MKNQKHYLFLLTSLSIAIFSFNCYALNPKNMPKRIQHERKILMDKQITPEDARFLRHLSYVFEDFTQLNDETLYLFKSIFPNNVEKSYKLITESLEKTAKKTCYYALKGKRPSRSLKKFISTFFPHNKNLKASLKDLFKQYTKFKHISRYIVDDFERDSLATGTYHYYNVCAKSYEEKFKKSIPETLSYSSAAYRALARSSRNPDIEYLKRILNQIDHIEYFEKAKILLQDEVVEKLKFANRNWGYNLILEMINTIQIQLELNKQLSKAIFKKINAIPTPSEPALPDLAVTSLKVLVPKNKKKYRKVMIVAEIKNVGEISAASSTAKIYFPNGKTKEKSIPQLPGGKSYTFKYTYKIRTAGKKPFKVIANYQQKAWERNLKNNIKRKTLTVKSR